MQQTGVSASNKDSQYSSISFEDKLIILQLRLILTPTYISYHGGITEGLNKTFAYVLTLDRGGNIQEVVQQAGLSLNINSGRSLKCSSHCIFNKPDSYVIRNRNSMHKRRHHEIKTIIHFRLYDIVVKRSPNSANLGPNYSSTRQIVETGINGLWFRLENDNVWNHIRNLRG